MDLSMSGNTQFKDKAFRTATAVVSVACIVGLVLIGLAVTCSFLVPLVSNAVLSSKVVLGKLAIVNVCVLFGMFQSLLGVLLILLGITAPYSMETETGSIKVSLISASPGILLVVISACLIWISVRSEFRVSSESFEVINPQAALPATEKSSPNQKSQIAPLGVEGPE
jgi:hypothetical protein